MYSCDAADGADVDRLASTYHMPRKSCMKDEAGSLATAICQMAGGDGPPAFQLVEKGGLWSKRQQHVTDINVHFFRIPGTHGANGVSRAMVCAFCGAMKQLLEIPSAKVEIVYLSERSPIHHRTIDMRKTIKVPFEKLIKDKLKDFNGAIEAVKFHGYVKTDAVRIVCTEKGDFESPPGLYVPATFGIFNRTDAEEDYDDRLTRIEKHCHEGRWLAVARNIRSLLNKTRLAREFARDLRQFPRVKNVHQLCESAGMVQDSLSGAIAACGRLEMLCYLMEAAIRIVRDVDTQTYCKRHMGLLGMTRARLIQSHDECRKRVQQQGLPILLKFRSSYQNILPFNVTQRLLDAIDGILHVGSGRWRFVISGGPSLSWPGDDFAALDGDEEVLILQVKRCDRTTLLRNVGFEFSERVVTHHTVISWKEAGRLSPEQRELKELASKAVFRSLVPTDVLQGRKRLEEVQIARHVAPPEIFKEESREEEEAEVMTLPTFLKKTGCLQVPDPSISPICAAGAFVFLTPAVTRDLSEMVAQCRRHGFRVGFGTIIVSKHLERLVSSVLRIGQVDFECGFFKIKSRHTVKNLHRNAVAESFRHQGLTSTKSTLKATAPRYFEDHPIFTNRDADSVETRLTRSTGYQPRHPSPYRPADCDLSYRQPLPGNIRARGFFRHRKDIEEAGSRALKSHARALFVAATDSEEAALDAEAAAYVAAEAFNAFESFYSEAAVDAAEAAADVAAEAFEALESFYSSQHVLHSIENNKIHKAKEMEYKRCSPWYAKRQLDRSREQLKRHISSDRTRDRDAKLHLMFYSD